MKVSINLDRCSGHGRCYVTAPELFADDDMGRGQVIGTGEVTEHQRAGAEMAVVSCPEQAVSVQ